MKYFNGYWAVPEDEFEFYIKKSYPEYICNETLYILNHTGGITERNIFGKYIPITDKIASDMFLRNAPVQAIMSYKIIQMEKDSLWDGLDV